MNMLGVWVKNLKLSCDWRSVLVSSFHLELMAKLFFFCIDSCGFLYVGRPLWREAVSVIYFYNCFWAFARAVALESGSRRAHDHVILSHFRQHQRGRPGPRIYIPHEQGSPVLPSATEFPFRRLLRLGGFLWDACQLEFPALPDFLSSGSGMEPTQPREYNWGVTWKKTQLLRYRNPRLRP
jgi:hypothetical protein